MSLSKLQLAVEKFRKEFAYKLLSVCVDVRSVLKYHMMRNLMGYVRHPVMLGS
jgi:hypothetical protein